jgi:hypothetical protein
MDTSELVALATSSHTKRRRRTVEEKCRIVEETLAETLEYVPEHFKVIRQVRPKLACAYCDKIVQAEAASRPIGRGIAGPGFHWPGGCSVFLFCAIFRMSSLEMGFHLSRTSSCDLANAATAFWRLLPIKFRS